MNYFIAGLQYVPKKELLLGRAGLNADSEEGAVFLELLDNIAACAKPKAYMTAAMVSDVLVSPAIRVGGVEFVGVALYGNIRDAKEVWPFVATCGMEAYSYVSAIPDPFERFWGDMILEDVLSLAVNELNAYAARAIYSGRIASIAPGSLIEWPIEQQVPLFRLLGDGPAKCGITLTDTLLMLPYKSVSGIFFPSERGYVSCEFCARNLCPRRRAEFKSDAAAKASENDCPENV